jgi:hypothetical protein
VATIKEQLAESFRSFGLSDEECRLAAGASTSGENPANHGGRSVSSPVVQHDGTRAYQEINRQNELLRGRR